DLKDGIVDFALVGSVAEQNNLLVRYHFDRLYGADRPVAIDCAAFWVLALERSNDSSTSRTLVRECGANFKPATLIARELPVTSRNRPFLCGPSEISLQFCLDQAAGKRGPFEYRHETWDGVTCFLRGEFPQ